MATRISLAELYVLRSNDHDVDRIRPLMSESVSYRSSNVGEFRDREPVLSMMAGFFQSYPDVAWETSGYALTADRSVTFNFVLTATNAETGESLNRHGEERIDFDENDLIQHIEVDSRA